MEERNVNTWEEFERELKDLREERGKSNEFLKSSLLYRGQENSCWLLSTTLDRNQERRNERRFLDCYLNAFSLFGSEESLMETWL